MNNVREGRTPVSPRPPGIRERWTRIMGRSTSLHNALFALFIGAILAYGAAFAWYMLDRFDLVNLLRDVNGDDSFYYFQIASHMAAGEFSTFDGGLTRTNGYHPLWLFLITPFYWVFDKVEALFAIKAFEIMLIAGGVAAVAGAARVARLPWILLLAALPALYRNLGLFEGLEAAAGLFLLGLFLLAVCLFERAPARWRWPLAAVAFALPWVRLEYAAIAVSATAALCVVEWMDRRPFAPVRGRALASDFPTHPPRLSGSSLLALYSAAPLFGALAGVLVYFAWNGIVFGGIVPVSGATKQFWSQINWEQEGGYSLTETVHEYLRMYAFDDELLVALEVCFYAALVWRFSRRSRDRGNRLLLAFLIGVSGLAAGHTAQFVHGVLTTHPDFGSYPWYFVPAYLMEAIIVPVRCYVAIWFIRRFIGRIRAGAGAISRVSSISNLAIIASGAAFLFARADFDAPFRFVDQSRENTSYEWEVSSFMGTMVMNRVLAEDSVVGSWDSGVIGYFSRFPVVNLDGLVNSWDYLHAQKDWYNRHPPSKWEYYAQKWDYGRDLKEVSDGAVHFQRGITIMANLSWPQALHDTALFEGTFLGVNRTNLQFKFWFPEWLRESWSEVDRSAWFWERMEPHLERQADGTALLVNGRMAQAFARDCMPDEMLEWTWERAGQDETVFGRWLKTSIGFCSNFIVLPHDALSPVRSRTVTVGEYLVNRIGQRLPAIRSDFDVYLVENSLVYVKEPCGQEDVEELFFLHVGPSVPDDLPDHRKKYGFDNLDFGWIGPGAKIGGMCLAEVPLPEYGIAAIRTGQYAVTEDGARNIWEGEIRFE